MTRITTPFGARTTAQEILSGVDLTGRTYIVTGGSSGIGAETTRALALAGARVDIATRTPSAARDLTAELPGVTATQVDLADGRSVRSFVDRWSGPLDGIVANAGIMALPARRTSAEGWELQLATNYLGHFRLITGLRSQLARNAGRVVTVSSGAQLANGVDLDDLHFERRPYDPWTAYSQSKAATVLLAVAASRDWAADGITANSLAPGSIHTNLQRHLDEDTMRAFGAMDAAGALVTPDHYKTPAQGAATSVLLAASPLLDGVTGRYFEDNQEVDVAAGPGVTTGVASWSVDPDVAQRLWDRASEAASSLADAV